MRSPLLSIISVLLIVLTQLELTVEYRFFNHKTRKIANTNIFRHFFSTFLLTILQRFSAGLLEGQSITSACYPEKSFCKAASMFWVTVIMLKPAIRLTSLQFLVVVSVICLCKIALLKK